MDSLFKSGENADAWIPVDVSFIKEFWLPDAEILNLKEFKTLDVLSKLEGLWLNRNFEIMVIWVVKFQRERIKIISVYLRPKVNKLKRNYQNLQLYFVNHFSGCRLNSTMRKNLPKTLDQLIFC